MALGANLVVWAAAIVSGTATAAPETLVVMLEVNGVTRPEPVIVYRSGNDYRLPTRILSDLGVTLDGLGRTKVDGIEQVSVADIKGLELAFDASNQRLRLTLPAAAFRARSLSYAAAPGGTMSPSGRGGFLNYDLTASTGGGATGVGGSLEFGYFAGSSFASATSALRWDGDGARFVRLDTSWSRADVGSMTTLRVGDSVSRGGAGGAPVRFTGIQYGRSFSMRPGYVTMPMPTIAGEAALPSVVDLYVNHVLAGSRHVQPGPFQIEEVPIVSGDGTITAIVRDVTGRQTVVTENYFASPSLLRRGLRDFGYETGFLRREYGLRSASYGAAFASATERLGLTDRLTVGSHAAVTADVQELGATADLALPGAGLVGMTLGASHSPSGAGTSAEIRFEHRAQSFSLSGSATYRSADYTGVGSVREARGASTTLQIYAGVPLNFGSLSLAYFLRDREGTGWDVENIGLRGSFRLARLGSLQLSARRSFGANPDLVLEAALSVRLGRSTTASTEVRRQSDGVDAFAIVRRAVPFGEGWGYRAQVSRERARPGFGFWGAVNTASGEYGAEVFGREGAVGGRVSAAGAIALLDGAVSASRPLDESFAIVSVEGQKGVRVYADNHLVGRTDAKGRVIVPRLRPYEANSIRLEYADLPIDAAVAEGVREVRPYARAGVSVRFRAERSKAAMLHIEIEGQGPLPAGSIVRLRGREFLAAPGGHVYLEGLEPANDVEIQWAAGSCSLRINVPASDDPQPDLGMHRCTPLKS